MTPGILTSSCRGLRGASSLHRHGRSRISCLICNGAIMTFGKYFSSKTAVGTLFALNCKALLITVQNTSWLLGRKILIKHSFKTLYIPYHSLPPVSPSPAKIQGKAHNLTLITQLTVSVIYVEGLEVFRTTLLKRKLLTLQERKTDKLPYCRLIRKITTSDFYWIDN